MEGKGVQSYHCLHPKTARERSGDSKDSGPMEDFLPR